MSDIQHGITETPATAGFRKAMRTAWDNVPFLVIVAIAFFGSFNHIVELAERHGQKSIEAMAIAVVVDLLCYVGAKERNRDKKLGREKKWGLVAYPTVVLTLGVVTTLTANLATASRGTWGHIVAAIPAAVLLLVIALLERRTTHTPKIAGPVPAHGPEVTRDHAQGHAGRDRTETRDQSAQDQDQPIPVIPERPAVKPAVRAPSRKPAAAERLVQGPMRSMDHLQREALAVIAEHNAETGECTHGGVVGKRLSNKELGRAIQVSNDLVGEIRRQIKDREEAA